MEESGPSPRENTVKEKDTMANTNDLGAKVVDSYIVRRKQMGSAHPKNNLSSSTSGTPIHSNLLIPGTVYSTPTRFTPVKPQELCPLHQNSSDMERDTSIVNTGGDQQTANESHSQSSSEPNKTQGNQSPTKSSPSFANPTHIVGGSLSPESAKSSPSRRATEVLDSLQIQTQASISESLKSGTLIPPNSNLRYNSIGLPYVVGDPLMGYPEDARQPRQPTFNPPQSGISAKDSVRVTSVIPKPIPHHNQEVPSHTSTSQAPNRHQSKQKDWSALFNAQSPSKTMKLEHYPELQQGKNAVVELDETHLDDRKWSNCLIGYFLDGKMPFALLSSTARTAWKDHGRINIKQIGACFFFEFQDEATKIKVLEGGPYFFSRRYLVLKDWRRMLIPSTEHPSAIPAWVKLHKLPLECWTKDGFSRIASAIGKPLHVDKATEKQQRLDFARVCVEIEANADLPSEIQITVKGESVIVVLEYQWLPPQCKECKVFGHSCCPKANVKASTSNNLRQGGKSEEWQIVSNRKASNQSLRGIDALEAVTINVPNGTGNAYIINPKAGNVLEDDDNTSEEMEEEYEVDKASISDLSLLNTENVVVVPTDKPLNSIEELQTAGPCNTNKKDIEERPISEHQYEALATPSIAKGDGNSPYLGNAAVAAFNKLQESDGNNVGSKLLDATPPIEPHPKPPNIKSAAGSLRDSEDTENFRSIPNKNIRPTGQELQESNSARKRRLKKERNLLEQGSL